MKLKSIIVITLIAIICTVIFIINLFIPLGINLWVFYIIPILLAYYYFPNKFLIPLVSLIAILMFINLLTSKSYIPIQYAVFNRIAGAGLFYLIVLFMLQQKKSKNINKEMNDLLKEKVEEMELKNAELKIAKSIADNSASAKAQFLSAMSHEIRTPMNTIIGMTHIMLEENPMPEQLDNLRILKFSSEGLLALINDILDFSKIDAGKIDFESVDFNVKNLVNDIVRSQNLRAIEKNINLNAVIDKDVPEMVVGDPTRLGQILNNLVGNAVKFTEKGSVHVDVVLEKTIDNNCSIKFSVIDTGIGITEGQTENIFENFTQGEKNITRRFGGTGLGLAITKKLLEQQNSRIFVESKEGKGSKFYFILELQKSLITNSQLKKSSYSNTDFVSMKGIKVLMAEDNEANQFIAKKFLNKWGIEVDIAVNGLEAVEKMSKENNYDLILMDLQMPYLDGYEAAERIRNLDTKYAKIPIIALTASALMDVHDRIIMNGMDDFVTKPFIPNDLYNKVKKWAKKE